MKPNRLAVLTLAALLVWIPAPGGAAEELSPKEIMHRVDRANRTDDSRRTLNMTLINKRGSTREREVISFQKKIDDQNDKALVKFLAPGDIAGTGLLTIEHGDRDDDQWLYLPALKKTRRISAADKNDSFMGTDFTYEDMSSLKLDQYGYKKLGQEEISGIRAVMIEMMPNNEDRKKESGYSRSVSWIDTERYVLLKADYYNLKAEHIKTLHASEFNQYGGIWMADRMEMETLKTGHQTVLVFGNTEVNVGLDDGLFTERYLMRGR